MSRRDVLLNITSLLSILLATSHLADEIVRVLAPAPLAPLRVSSVGNVHRGEGHEAG